MQSIQSLTVISLGGGVQSSVMALMASGGAFGQLPDCVIFAATHWEPPTIYTHLDWLSRNLSFPLYIVDNGRSLREDAKALTNHSGNRGFIDLPLYRKGPARAGVRNGQVNVLAVAGHPGVERRRGAWLILSFHAVVLLLGSACSRAFHAEH